MGRLLRHALGRVSSTGTGPRHLGSRIEVESIRPDLWFRSVFSLRVVPQQLHHSLQALATGESPRLLAGLPFGARLRTPTR